MQHIASKKNTKSVTAAKKVEKPRGARVVALPELVSVPLDYAFWTVDGQVFYSLKDLYEGLAVMPERVYAYHADKAYQDFAKWVAGAIQDKVCARELKTAVTAKAARKVLEAHLKRYRA